MCGIAGILSFAGDYGPMAEELFAMNQALKHRGPDDEGYLLWNPAESPRNAYGIDTMPAIRSHAGYTDWHTAVGRPFYWGVAHRRFSIIDVSAGGHQPFYDATGQVAVVFNGEIYNYCELRDELCGHGMVFNTRSDTEVLLKAYLAWGEDAFPRLNGMWGVAILDFRRQQVLLSRDRAGERPLYYTRQDSCLYFASEIKALFAVPKIWGRRRADPLRVWDYLYAGLRDHRPGSMFAGIEQLAPATVVCVGLDGVLHEKKYWSLPRRRRSIWEISFDEATKQFSGMLDDSVRLRLRADVPIAGELSGGIDSTAIVESAARQLRRQDAAHPLSVYTIRYPDKAFDESGFAEETARQVGAEFHPLLLEARDYWGAADELMRIQEQPYESANQLGARAMWTTMSQRGVRVSLTGMGGDELLAGYMRGMALPFFGELIRSGRWGEFRREWPHWRGTEDCDATRLRRYLLNCLPPAWKAFYFNRARRVTWLRILRSPGSKLWPQISRDATHRVGGCLSKVLERAYQFYAFPVYMAQGDRTCMSVPIEVRPPFLDHRLIELAFELPITYFFRNGFTKSLMREALRGRVPNSVVDRRDKMGFSVPLDQWMQAGGKRILEDVRSNPALAEYIDIKQLADNFARIPGYILWQIHQVAMWWRIYDLPA